MENKWLNHFEQMAKGKMHGKIKSCYVLLNNTSTPKDDQHTKISVEPPKETNNDGNEDTSSSDEDQTFSSDEDTVYSSDEEAHLPQHLTIHASERTINKRVNDLLNGLYSKEFLANHSLAGRCNKPPLPSDKVYAIIQDCIRVFPSARPSNVRSAIRRKLNNACK